MSLSKIRNIFLLSVLSMVASVCSADKKYVIAVEVSEGYLEMFNNWLNHLDKMNNTLRDYIYATAHDETSCLHLESLNVRHNCYNLKVKSNLMYNTPDFNKLTCERPKNMLRHLESGNTVLYTDIDTIWLRNVLEYFQGVKTSLVLQLDLPHGCAHKSCEGITWKSCQAEKLYFCHKVCTCLIGIRPSRDTRSLMRSWIRGCGSSKHKQDQKVFREVVVGRRFSSISRTFFPPQLFLSGGSFFGVGSYVPESTPKEVLTSAYWVHNNWIAGEDAKKRRFKDHGLWNTTQPVISYG